MPLIIVESPTKSKTISKFVGREYQVLSSYGHIRDLPKQELGIDVKHQFSPRYIVPTKAKKVVSQLKKAARQSELIILATDEDREGEAIAWHITQALEQKTKKAKAEKEENSYQRIAFHEITEPAVKKALKNPRAINMDLVYAQQTRRILDRLVGYKLSPFLWDKVVKGLSAGRVQSAVVRLIVDREREIKAFRPEEYWTLHALLKKTGHEQEISARLVQRKGKNISKDGLKNEQETNKIVEELAEAQYQVKEIQKKEINKKPLPPFTTSTLQQEAARKLGFSAKQTMILAQQLYEGVNLGGKGSVGLITYHRTDSLNLSQASLTEARKIIQSQFGASYLPHKPNFYKNKSKGAQEAHEAIRPSQPRHGPGQIGSYLDPRQEKLYRLIWQRFIACQMNPAVLSSTSIDIAAQKNKKEVLCLFRANGSILKFDGFLKVYPLKLKEALLPPIKEKEMLELIKLLPEQHFTQPPARYNEASLVKVLEEYGVGRPSTYAPIISTVQARGYVQKNEQKRFVPSETAFIVIDLLKENFPEIVDIEFTARMEKDLDKIAQGKKEWTEVLRGFYNPFNKKLAQKYKDVSKTKTEEPTDKKCPLCGAPMVIKLGRFGRFYSCSNFPKCKHAEPIAKPTGVKCPQCQKGKIVERKTKKGKTFYSCSRYPKCKYALWDKPLPGPNNEGEKCPRCGSLMAEDKKGKIKCSNSECRYEPEPKEPPKDCGG